MQTAALACNGIRRRAAMFNRFLIRLQTIFDEVLYDMMMVIEEKGTDFRKFSEEDKKSIASAMSLAGAIKSILDIPILDESGNLTDESETILEIIQEKVDSIIV